MAALAGARYNRGHMDPVTQGLLGAAASQAVLGKRLGKRAAVLGALSGMAADLDVLIRSGHDPLMAWEYHRNFTHSLAFVPIGGVLCALPFLVRKAARVDARAIVMACMLGYGTHGLLDAFTSYGTMLYWPLSRARVAWHGVAIIDPIYTVALAIGVWFSWRRGTVRPARWALLVTSLYLGFGLVQRQRAEQAVRKVADEHIDTVVVMPTIGTNVVWRGLYTSSDAIRAVAVRVPWIGRAHATLGERGMQATLSPAEAQDARTEDAFEFFAWFTSGMMSRRSDGAIMDVRFTTELNALDGMWGIALHPGESEPVWGVRHTPTNTGATLGTLWNRVWTDDGDNS